jgi:hypothetical protein
VHVHRGVISVVCYILCKGCVYMEVCRMFPNEAFPNLFVHIFYLSSAEMMLVGYSTGGGSVYSIIHKECCVSKYIYILLKEKQKRNKNQLHIYIETISTNMTIACLPQQSSQQQHHHHQQQTITPADLTILSLLTKNTAPYVGKFKDRRPRLDPLILETAALSSPASVPLFLSHSHSHSHSHSFSFS